MNRAVNVTIKGENIPQSEIDVYIKRGIDKFGDRLKGIEIEADGEYVNLTYDVPSMPFQRIRRITGYLVGDLSRFNNGKRAEEHDRVKHTMGT